MREALVKLSEVSRSFGDQTVLNEVNLDLYPSQLVFLNGRNGAGKTTLLRLVATLLEPTKGTVWVSRGTRMGWAPSQDKGFNERLTAQENLAIHAALMNESQSKVGEVISLFKKVDLVDGCWDRSVKDLSSGMRQILRVVKAFLGLPLIVLLDEPFRHLDKETIDQLVETIEEIVCTRKVTIVISNHIKVDALENLKVDSMVYHIRNARVIKGTQ